MKNKIVFFLLLFVQIKIEAQLSPTDEQYRAYPVGIDNQLENILETQLTLPKAILTTNYVQKVTLFLNVDSLGNPTNIRFFKGLNSLVCEELKRIVKMMRYKRTLHLPQEEAPYFLEINLSTVTYNKYRKQKEKPIVKSKLPIDTNLLVYSRANKSPEFYKNGDEGLKEFFLNELEYPKEATFKTIEGTVLLDFVVETNGYVSNIEVRKGVNGGCTLEAIRLIQQTRWQPAEKNNQLVRYKITYPITFTLNKEGIKPLSQMFHVENNFEKRLSKLI
jgi:TonB family protein